MSERITSANGTTVGAEEEIVSVMRTFTTLNYTEDKFNPFRPKSLYLECDTETAIYVNGENATSLKEDLSTGKFFINLGLYNIVVKTLKLEDFEKDMEGVNGSSVCKETLDEALAVYKPTDEILKQLHETVDVTHHLKPIFNFKAK
jgi:hypothetical protein